MDAAPCSGAGGADSFFSRRQHDANDEVTTHVAPSNEVIANAVKIALSGIPSSWPAAWKASGRLKEELGAPHPAETPPSPPANTHTRVRARENQRAIRAGEGGKRPGNPEPAFHLAEDAWMEEFENPAKLVAEAVLEGESGLSDEEAAEEAAKQKGPAWACGQHWVQDSNGAYLHVV